MASTQYSVAELGKRQLSPKPYAQYDFTSTVSEKIPTSYGEETEQQEPEQVKTTVSTPVGSENTEVETVYTQDKIPTQPAQPQTHQTVQYTRRIPTINSNGIPHENYWQYALGNNFLWGGHGDLAAKMAAAERDKEQDVITTTEGDGSTNGRVASTLLNHDKASIKDLIKLYMQKQISQEDFEAQWREKAQAYIDHGGDIRTLLSPTGLASDMMKETEEKVENTVNTGAPLVSNGNMSQSDYENSVEKTMAEAALNRAKMKSLSGKVGGVSNLGGFKLWTSGALQKPMTAEAIASYYQGLFKQWSEDGTWNEHMAQLDPMGDHLMKLATDASNTIGENEKVRMQYQAMSPEEKKAAERELLNYFNALQKVQAAGAVRSWSTDKQNKFNETLGKLQKAVNAVADPSTNDKGKAIGDGISEVHAYFKNGNDDLPAELGTTLQAINDAHDAYWKSMMLQGSQNPKFLAALARQVYERNKALIDKKGINAEASPYAHSDFVDFDVDKAMRNFEANKVILNPPDYVKVSALAMDREGLTDPFGNNKKGKTTRYKFTLDDNGNLIRGNSKKGMQL